MTRGGERKGCNGSFHCVNVLLGGDWRGKGNIDGELRPRSIVRNDFCFYFEYSQDAVLLMG